MSYQACISIPYAVLGIHCTNDAVTGIDFLPIETAPIAPSNHLASKVCATVERYLQNPRSPLDLPMACHGTPFQRRVWEAIRRIPTGETVTYAELARHVGSGARAVANACGANPLPLLIPCHRVVAKNGLGGFMQGRENSSLDIKRWLLEHERSASSAA
jgi:methylated-DNA-[protein]-cysteine S-methyltransferase